MPNQRQIPTSTQECRCDEAALSRGISDANCPFHGIAAFIRSLPDDPDESDGFEVNDGFEI